MLTASGISRVVTGGDVFQEVVIRRDPERVALTSPMNASGVFELDTQAEMLLPFEAMGVATSPTFEMPRPANPFDFNTIADVLVTIDYTALYSTEYRMQVIQRFDPIAGGEQMVSLRNDFPDQWYDLHNPSVTSTPSAVDLRVPDSYFPPNLSEIRLRRATFAFIPDGAGALNITIASMQYTPAITSASVPVTVEIIGQPTQATEGRFRWTPSSAVAAAGRWKMVLHPTTQALFEEGKVRDILLMLAFEGRRAAWPSMNGSS